MIYSRTECKIAKDGNDFIGEGGAANGCSNNGVHALLRVGLELIVDGE